MGLEPIGILVLALGFLSFLAPESFSIYLFVIGTLLGSSAAVTLGSSGQIQPAHLFLGFTTICILSRSFYLDNFVKSMKYPQAGYWLTCFSAFGIFSAYFFPRLFEGKTYINAVGSTELGPSILLTPLAPVGGNITQTIYLVADLSCFLLFSALCKSKDGTKMVAKSMIWYASANIFFGVADLATYYSNTAFIMDPIRNAQYTFHLDEETAGLKRIAGSFTETSSFSYATIGSLSFCLTLWLRGRWPSATGILSLLSLFFLVLSTSSTAILVTPLVVAVGYITAISELKKPGADRRASWFVLGLPPLTLLLIFIVTLNQTALNTVAEFLNVLVFEKANSQSGLERASWNLAAMQNFLDTDFMGAGLGSVRASSFPVAVIANAGIIGGVFMFIFMTLLFSSYSYFVQTDKGSDFIIAARNSCLGLLFAATVSGSLVDLGLTFYVFAAVACSRVQSV